MSCLAYTVFIPGKTCHQTNHTYAVIKIVDLAYILFTWCDLKANSNHLGITYGDVTIDLVLFIPFC